MSWLLAPFHYGFMQHGLIAAVLAGITCAMLGVYVVLRRMAFLGDALAHSILPGMVVASLHSWNLFAGALVAGLLTALGIGYLSQRAAVHEDTAIGLLFTGMFALGIVLMSTTRSFRDLSHMRFGNSIGVTASDLALIAAIAILVVVLLVLFHKELELTSVDPTYAAVIGLRADTVRYGLMTLLTGADHRGGDAGRRRGAHQHLTDHPSRHGVAAHQPVSPSDAAGRPAGHWRITRRAVRLLVSQRLLRSGDCPDLHRLFRPCVAGANRYPIFSALQSLGCEVPHA